MTKLAGEGAWICTNGEGADVFLDRSCGSGCRDGLACRGGIDALVSAELGSCPSRQDEVTTWRMVSVWFLLNFVPELELKHFFFRFGFNSMRASVPSIVFDVVI